MTRDESFQAPEAALGTLADGTVVRLADGRLAYVDRCESAEPYEEIVRLGTPRTELSLPADAAVTVVLTPRQLAQLYVLSPAIRRVAALVLSLCEAARDVDR